MSTRRIPVILAILFLAGCGGASPAPTLVLFTPTLAPTPSATTPILPTPTTEPTATSTATPIPTFPPMQAAQLPTGPGAEWRLMIISESSGWGLGKAFASRIEQDTGVKVTLNDYALGNLSAADVLDRLQPADSPLLALVSKADVILLFPGPLGSVHGDTFLNLSKCLGDGSGTPGAYSAGGFDGYTADLAAIWARILAARSGKATLLRALDDATPFIGPWNRDQMFGTCSTYWEAYSAAARTAAGLYSIPFLSRFEAYNGENHDIDPGQGGYIGPDGIHPNDLAQDHTAELLSRMGYYAVAPP
jgi:hypothetical protein